MASQHAVPAAPQARVWPVGLSLSTEVPHPEGEVAPAPPVPPVRPVQAVPPVKAEGSASVNAQHPRTRGKAKVPVGTRAKVGPQHFQKIEPRTPEEREKARMAIARTRQVDDMFGLNFEFTNIIALGQQSSGKTSFVERFLAFPFSRVESGMATTRPAVLTILPKTDGTNPNDVITVFEELSSGAKTEPKKLQDGPGGKSALQQLFDWCVEKNRNTMPVKEKLMITIETKACDTPKRLIDLPGVRASDAPGDEGVNEMIVDMVTAELKKPNAMVLCFAEASTDPLNDNMRKLLANSQAVESWGDLQKRLRLVLTKSDEWLEHRGADAVRKHLQDWRHNFFGCEPMLMGYTFDLKKMGPEQSLEARKRELDVACARDGEKIRDLVLDRALDMDLANLNNSIRQIQHRQNEVTAKLSQKRKDLERHNPEELKEQARSLVSATLGEANKFMIAMSGPGREQLFSRPGVLKEIGKTLMEEEVEFIESRWEYSSDEMLKASQDKGACIIDYMRTDEHAPGHFDKFYEQKLNDEKFMKSVPGCDDRLQAGAAYFRAKEFFRLLALHFVHPDEGDRDRILNCSAINPDAHYLEDNVTRLVEVLRGKAATMRETAQYFVQKTVHVGVKCLSYAWMNMKESKQKERPIIDRLAGNSHVDDVFEALRTGFLNEFLWHGQHAYVSCISDHGNRMHQLGCFGRDENCLLPEGVNQEEVCKQKEAHNASLKELVKKHLPKDFEANYPQAWLGVQEGLCCVSKTGWCDQVPNLTGRFIRDLINKNILKEEPKGSKDNDSTARRGYLSDRLRRMDPNSQNEFFGEIAVLYAFMIPLFQMDVESRCASGLMRSCSDQSYRYGFELSMFKELKQDFLDDETMEASQKKLESEVEALEFQNEHLESALKSLRGLMKA